MRLRDIFVVNLRENSSEHYYLCIWLYVAILLHIALLLLPLTLLIVVILIELRRVLISTCFGCEFIGSIQQQ